MNEWSEDGSRLAVVENRLASKIGCKVVLPLWEAITHAVSMCMGTLVNIKHFVLEYKIWASIDGII